MNTPSPPHIQCDTKAALNAFHHQVFEEPTKIGITGSGCSVSTEPTAIISHYYMYNLVQVYYYTSIYTGLIKLSDIGARMNCMYTWNFSEGVSSACSNIPKLFYIHTVNKHIVIVIIYNSWEVYIQEWLAVYTYIGDRACSCVILKPQVCNP